jgi:prolyl oligopeptidase
MRSWYDRGDSIAFAHVRGGGEYGEAWHMAGFQATKPNTWKDFIACAQYLVDRRYTNPHKLFGWAQSAGGILIGRAIEERPDLFGAAVIRVPAADMVRFQTTANGPGNIPEFGDVRTPAGFKALYAMSPYAHVEDGAKYPPVLVYAGANDQRVAAWIPTKFAARLQAATASGKPVLLRVHYDAGHTGFDATRRQSDLNTADMIAFALWQTGDPDFQPSP